MMGWRVAHLPVLLLASGALLAVAVAGGWLAAGGPGAAGAAAGVGLAVASYLVSTLLIAWADSVNPSLVLPVGLAAYLVKIGLLGLLLVSLAGTGWAGLPAMAVGVVAGVVTWVGTQIWWVVAHPPRLVYRVPDHLIREDPNGRGDEVADRE